jgi:hypothetical protein
VVGFDIVREDFAVGHPGLAGPSGAEQDRKRCLRKEAREKKIASRGEANMP